MQVDPIQPKLKAPMYKRLKLKHDELPPMFAFEFNLRRYTSDAALDRLTALCATLCGAPSALISLLDKDRLWVKSRHNFEADDQKQFCGWTLQSRAPHDRVFVVNDASTAWPHRHVHVDPRP